MEWMEIVTLLLGGTEQVLPMNTSTPTTVAPTLKVYVKKKIKSMFDWLFESNRWKHLIGIFTVSLFGTILMGIGAIGGMEFKDVHHGNGNKPIRDWTWKAWDWLDCLAGLIGGLAATVLQALIVLLVWLV